MVLTTLKLNKIGGPSGGDRAGKGGGEKCLTLDS